MTETTIGSDSRRTFAAGLRAPASRSVRRWSVERGWPLRPAAPAGRQLCSSACPGSASSGAARHAAPCGCWSASASPRWPRSIRCASTVSRRPARSTAASSAPTGSRTRRCWCRPTGRADGQRRLRRRAVARAPAPHGRAASAASAATCRAPAFPSATPGACAPRRRCCSSTAFAFSFGPLGGSVADAFRPHAGDRRRPAAHRRLGDAAGLYRQGADLPDRRGQRRQRRSSPCRKAATVAARHRRHRARRRWSSPTRPARSRDIAPQARRPPTPAEAGRPRLRSRRAGAAVRRQADGRRHAVAEVRRRASCRSLGLRRDPRQAAGDPLLRRAEARGQRRAGTRLRDRGRLRRGLGRAPSSRSPKRRRRTRARSTSAPEMPLALPRRGAKGPAAKTSRDLTEHVWAGAQREADAEGDGRRRPGSARARPRPSSCRSGPSPIRSPRRWSSSARSCRSTPTASRDVLDLIDAITLRPEDTFDNLSHYLGIMSRRARGSRWPRATTQLRDVADYLWQMALASRTATCRPPRSACARRRRR